MPRNDIGVWATYYPIWTGEICSSDKYKKYEESDFCRMVFQAAGLVSFLNWVEYGFEKIEGPGFVLPLVYIDAAFTARIYLMRQKDEGVSFTFKLLPLVSSNPCSFWLHVWKN
jgi:hypothetical protein